MAESEEEENKGPKQFFLQKFDVGSSLSATPTIAFATGEVEEAKLEGRPVTNTVIMHNGEEVDLEALLQKEKRPEPELEQSVPLDESKNQVWNGFPCNWTRRGKKDVNKDVKICNKIGWNRSYLNTRR
ncbi:hypothetical protein HAX54_029825 [Datura stramonium]|uniref:Uncharacterized protein n=1 Tax=Datura stramonium TaxID=4076 RepID=A0ABS8V6J8_DATST|nr:hypothetical protein [Datura stramonium]